jgi:hypothetical protein
MPQQPYNFDRAMTMVMSREQAAEAVAAILAQRDGIQANLLDLDGSFGKRLLAGASLAGQTRQRWDAAAAELAIMWEIFTAYSAVIDRAAELLARVRRSSGPELAEITELFTGTSVRLASAPAPLARRELTDSGLSEFTLNLAVVVMRRSFTVVAEVVTLAESVWNEVADRLRLIGTELEDASRLADGLGDDALTGALAGAAAELGRLREMLNADPLSLWRGGRVDTAGLDRLREQAAAAVSRAGQLARLRDDAQRRIAALAAAVAAAGAAAQDATVARERAAAKIAMPPPPLPRPPDVANLAGRLAGLDGLRAAGRWTRLASDLDVMERQAAAATQHYRDAELQATALLARRDELRGLLDAYQAKAAGVGGAEDLDLSAHYDQARELLWSAPCDLSAAAAAVTSYQQAISVLSGRRQQR